MRVPVIACILLTISWCVSRGFADEFSSHWQVLKGADNVKTFQVISFPDNSGYSSLAMSENSNSILVFPGRLNLPLQSNPTWTPDGYPNGYYAYTLDLAANTVTLISMEQISYPETDWDGMKRTRSDHFDGIDFAGSDVGMATVYQQNGRELIAVSSANSNEKKKTSFGIPSIIPFMGRQKFFETKTLYDGTLYLEIFDTSQPAEPLVQLEQTFKNFLYSPVYVQSPQWVQGSEEPILIFVESANQNRGPFTIYAIACPSQRDASKTGLKRGSDQENRKN